MSANLACLVSLVNNTKFPELCGLYYKHVMIVNDDFSIIKK
jgi:hypothetical protein